MTLPAYAMNASSFPDMYERFLVEPLFRPFAEALLERVAPGPGDRVLDIACGTGIVARLAHTRTGASGVVVGVDLSPQMLTTARSVAPDVDWREGSADALPLAEGETFDVVTCHQGLQFFPDTAAAAREMRRALAAHGRVAVGVWTHLDAIPFVAELHRIAERHLGPVIDRRHNWQDPGELRDVLTDAGLEHVDVEMVTRTVRFDEGSVFVRMNAMAIVGMSSMSKTMSDEARAEMVGRIVEDSSGVLERYTTADGLAFDTSTHLAVAAAPRVRGS